MPPQYSQKQKRDKQKENQQKMLKLVGEGLMRNGIFAWPLIPPHELFINSKEKSSNLLVEKPGRHYGKQVIIVISPHC